MTDMTLLVFDVNETLLDLSVLDEPFAEAFGAAEAKGEWFARLLHLSTVVTAVGGYADFSELGKQALQAVAVARGHDLDDTQRDRIMGGMRSLPAHEDAAEGLERLKEAGFRLAALSNSGLESVRSVLDQANLASWFDHILSVESTRIFKPRPEPYRHAAETIGVPVERLRLIAAHDWDCAGALAAGAQAAFLQRPGKSYASALPAPDLQAPDLPTLAARIIEVDEPS
jgi:2-haloacid dehalogenase